MDAIFEKAYDNNMFDKASWVSKAVLSQVWKAGAAEVKIAKSWWVAVVVG